MTTADAAVPAARGRVCIVDDEPGVRELLELVCESAELPSASFDSAESFLAGRCAGLDDPGLILLDVDLPGMDGLALLDLLKSQRLDTPVVMISGAGNIDRTTQAMKLGAADFFDKPFDIQALRRRICELVRRPA